MNTQGIFAEVFILLFVYWCLSFYSAFKDPQQDEQKKGEGASTLNKPNLEQKQPYTLDELDEFFRSFFGYHIVPVGMVLLYCSTIYGIVVSYLHLLSTSTL